MCKHHDWLNFAKKIAEKSTFPKFRMAAIVTKSGRPLSSGWNKLSPGILKNPIYGEHQMLHAECQAILQLEPKQLRNATIYVAGLTRGGNLLLSKPCDACMFLIKQAGIKRIVFHTKEGEVVIENI